MNGASALEPSPALWPASGVVRLHHDPTALPQLGDDPGSNRFDDPRPRTTQRFLIRYAASSLRGCLLEVLAHLRANAEAHEREDHPGAIHYRSRHDDAEDCWAIYHHQHVTFDNTIDLSPDVEEHVAAMTSVADLWGLPVPPAWSGRSS